MKHNVYTLSIQSAEPLKVNNLLSQIKKTCLSGPCPGKPPKPNWPPKPPIVWHRVAVWPMLQMATKHLPQTYGDPAMKSWAWHENISSFLNDLDAAKSPGSTNSGWKRLRTWQLPSTLVFKYIFTYLDRERKLLYLKIIINLSLSGTSCLNCASAPLPT